MYYDSNYDSGFRSVFECGKETFNKGVQELIEQGFLFTEDGSFYTLDFNLP
jgi:hypothetical protein